LKPGNGSFDRPAAFVSAQRSVILGLVFRFAVAPMRRNQFNAFFCQLIRQLVTVVGFVADRGRRG